MLKRGTWHSLDRYPLYPAESRLVIISSQETQIELESADPADRRLTQQVDFEARFGITFELGV